jgi:hypothetical protein
VNDLAHSGHTRAMSRLIVILLSLAALGALAGCGASDTINPDVVAQAADKTASAGGMKVAYTMDVDGQHLTGTGFFDTKGQKGRMSFEFPQAGGTVDAVMFGRVFYMHFPASLAKQFPGGKSWLKLDFEKAAKAQGIDIGALQSTSNTDPSQALDQLRGAGDVKKVGSETVRGTQTTHYTATLDLRKAADRAPADKRAAARSTIDALIKLAGTSTFPAEVWIDQRGRARRMKLNYKIQGKPFGMTMDMFGFGTREAIKPPPASQTKDITDLAAKGGQVGG